jgi:hypothetical protein
VRSEKAPVRSSRKGTSSASIRVQPRQSSVPLFLLAEGCLDTLSDLSV